MLFCACCEDLPDDSDILLVLLLILFTDDSALLEALSKEDFISFSSVCMSFFAPEVSILDSITTFPSAIVSPPSTHYKSLA